MSRLFPDTLVIELFADRVSLTRKRGLFGRQIAAAHTAPVLGSAGAVGSATLETLQTLLADAKWQDARADIRLSNALVGYTMVPASKQLLGAADELALAQLKFQQMHGSGTAQWEVRLDNLLSGASQLAAALDRRFLEKLLEVLAAARLKPVSIQPLLMHHLNQVRRKVAGLDVWFAHVDPGLLTLCRLQQGRLASLSATALTEALPLTLEAQVMQATLLAGTEGFPQRLYVYCHDLSAAGLTLHGLEVVDLSPRKIAAHPAASVAAPAAAKG